MPNPTNPLDRHPQTDIHTPIGAMVLWRVLALGLMFLPGWWRLFTLVPIVLEFASLTVLLPRIWHRGFLGGFGR